MQFCVTYIFNPIPLLSLVVKPFSPVDFGGVTWAKFPSIILDVGTTKFLIYMQMYKLFFIQWGMTILLFLYKRS